MTGSALFDFVISIIALIGAGMLVFLGIDFIAPPDERFRKIAKVAVGLAFLIIFLLAIKGVFFGGGGSSAITPGGLIEFAISLIVLMVVVYIINLVIDFFAGEIGAPIVLAIKYVVGAIALIVILYAAEKVILGGGLGMINFGVKRSELLPIHTSLLS
jgi:hypothetical protein